MAVPEEADQQPQLYGDEVPDHEANVVERHLRRDGAPGVRAGRRLEQPSSGAMAEELLRDGDDHPDAGASVETQALLLSELYGAALPDARPRLGEGSREHAVRCVRFRHALPQLLGLLLVDAAIERHDDEPAKELGRLADGVEELCRKALHDFHVAMLELLPLATIPDKKEPVVALPQQLGEALEHEPLLGEAARQHRHLEGGAIDRLPQLRELLRHTR
mmetsp:Transcript_8248/g.23627  ORF Transcript_8248/g.23627 Transcript_8248/m.23627 type:complete len:219 (-) Transcript_8248:803-1459(-)